MIQVNDFIDFGYCYEKWIYYVMAFYFKIGKTFLRNVFDLDLKLDLFTLCFNRSIVGRGHNKKCVFRRRL